MRRTTSINWRSMMRMTCAYCYLFRKQSIFHNQVACQVDPEAFPQLFTSGERLACARGVFRLMFIRSGDYPGFCSFRLKVEPRGVNQEACTSILTPYTIYRVQQLVSTNVKVGSGGLSHIYASCSYCRFWTGLHAQ